MEHVGVCLFEGTPSVCCRRRWKPTDLLFGAIMFHLIKTSKPMMKVVLGRGRLLVSSFVEEP